MLDELTTEELIEKAVAFITSRGGTVTSAELHTHLWLAESELASQKLAPALDDGRLVKSGKYWGLRGSSPCEEDYQPPEDPDAMLSDGDRVIAFIKRQPNLRATNHEVCKLLKLEPNEVPASRLGTCLATGRLRRHGTSWMVGLGELGEPPKVAAVKIDVPKRVIGSVVLVASSDDPAPRVVPVESGPHFRIGDWSDGSIELQRNGVHLATLTKDEFEQIGKFWSLRAA